MFFRGKTERDFPTVRFQGSADFPLWAVLASQSRPRVNARIDSVVCSCLVQLSSCVISSSTGDYDDLETEEYCQLELLRMHLPSARAILETSMTTWRVGKCFAFMEPTECNPTDVPTGLTVIRFNKMEANLKQILLGSRLRDGAHEMRNTLVRASSGLK
jgi:hypothetical protein